jgi:carboxylesterase type B
VSAWDVRKLVNYLTSRLVDNAHIRNNKKPCNPQPTNRTSSRMGQIILTHSKLGSIKCLSDPKLSLVKILGLPYGNIPRRFARAKPVYGLRHSLKEKEEGQNTIFDATTPGPSSIQPWGSVKSDASNIPLPTESLPEDENQSEDCLNLSIILPDLCLDEKQSLRKDAKLPVLVFIHGGAFFLGSANRPYYDATHFMHHAMQRETPVIYVGINYRLGALGFLHHPDTGDMVPENNGLYDQDVAFGWLQENIEDFGGDTGNMTVLGQSAGSESISVKTMRTPLFKRAIMLSGTPVTMPTMTHEEHGANFIHQANALGIRVKENDDGDRDPRGVAEDMIDLAVDKIRDLAWVGLPCSNSNFFPVERPSMRLVREGKLAPKDWKDWAKPVEAQIVGSTTYDGGISYNMMIRDKSRMEHARHFKNIAHDVLGSANGKALCEIYGLATVQNDADALQRICLFESDIGFFAAALSVAESNLVKHTYFQIFDLPNPFPGPIHEQGEFATHTFDIATLLGGTQEEQLPEEYKPVVSKWRNKILDFIVNGTPPCEEFIVEKGRNALLIDEEGVRETTDGQYLGCDQERRRRLFALAERVAGEDGLDVLWVDVCRRFLMKGK